VYDPGASANGITEAEETRRIATGVVFELASIGVPATLAPDGYLVDRYAWQRSHLTAKDTLVSLHLNAASTPTATGVEVFYAETKPYLRKPAEELGRVLANELDRRDRGAKPDSMSQHPSLGILRASGAASFLLELGFVTNAEDVTAVRNRGIKAVTASICTLTDHPLVFQPSPEQEAAFSDMIGISVYTAETPDNPGTPKNQHRYELAVLLKRVFRAGDKRWLRLDVTDEPTA